MTIERERTTEQIARHGGNELKIIQSSSKNPAEMDRVYAIYTERVDGLPDEEMVLSEWVLEEIHRFIEGRKAPFQGLPVNPYPVSPYRQPNTITIPSFGPTCIS